MSDGSCRGHLTSVAVRLRRTAGRACLTAVPDGELNMRTRSAPALIHGIESADLGTVWLVTEFAEDLRPVPESRMALDWLASYSRDRHLETSITTMGQRVRDIVSQCLALSLGLLEEGPDLHPGQ